MYTTPPQKFTCLQKIAYAIGNIIIIISDGSYFECLKLLAAHCTAFSQTPANHNRSEWVSLRWGELLSVLQITRDRKTANVKITDLLYLTIITGKVKAHELRTKSKGELLTQLKELKEELSTVNHQTYFSTRQVRNTPDTCGHWKHLDNLIFCFVSPLTSSALRK